MRIERKEVIPALLLICPVNIGIWGGSCLRGAIVVNASEGGFLIETVSDIPVGRELNITVCMLWGLNWLTSKWWQRLCGRNLIVKKIGKETSTGKDISMD